MHWAGWQGGWFIVQSKQNRVDITAGVGHNMTRNNLCTGFAG
jgi:hypothetical protein